MLDRGDGLLEAEWTGGLLDHDLVGTDGNGRTDGNGARGYHPVTDRFSDRYMFFG